MQVQTQFLMLQSLILDFESLEYTIFVNCQGLAFTNNITELHLKPHPVPQWLLTHAW